MLWCSMAAADPRLGSSTPRCGSEVVHSPSAHPIQGEGSRKHVSHESHRRRHHLHRQRHDLRGPLAAAVPSAAPSRRSFRQPVQ